jgi:hypothetical protein
MSFLFPLVLLAGRSRITTVKGFMTLDLGVGVVLDVHGSFLALGLANTGVSIGLELGYLLLT